MTKTIIKNIYPTTLIAQVLGVLYYQFCTISEYSFDIETSNYYVLIVSALILAVMPLPLIFSRKVKLRWGDSLMMLFTVYIIANAYFNGNFDSKDLNMSLAYLSIFFSLRMVMLVYPRSLSDYIK